MSFITLQSSLVRHPKRLCSCTSWPITASSSTQTCSALASAGTGLCPAPTLTLIPGHAAGTCLFHSTLLLEMRNIPVGPSSAPCTVPREKEIAAKQEHTGRATEIPGSFIYPDQTQRQGERSSWLVKKGAGGEMRIPGGCRGRRCVSRCGAHTALPLRLCHSSAEAMSQLRVYLIH